MLDSFVQSCSEIDRIPSGARKNTHTYSYTRVRVLVRARLGLKHASSLLSSSSPSDTLRHPWTHHACLLWALLTKVRMVLTEYFSSPWKAALRIVMVYFPGQQWHYWPHSHQGLSELGSQLQAPLIHLPKDQGGAFTRQLTMHRGVAEWGGGVKCSLGTRNQEELLVLWSTLLGSGPSWWDGITAFLQGSQCLHGTGTTGGVGREYALC